MSGFHLQGIDQQAADQVLGVGVIRAGQQVQHQPA
jgi:hypothetical protein